ncbi:uncharacterized protein LTR77_006715 [Saxophila tyrrhenica]|uniref:FAD-binding PCMH-type domain-containing protein n=1 Tax=Saxophila tyrrhenica TaxID=1690608 RepID=A0AAV9P7M3_9PEZI|nr:hypothetical protein LTR77_006715 [Saxophila tyrrhenica]
MAFACCTALASQCPGLAVALPDSLAYNKTELSYWSLQEATLRPSCIVTPQTSHEAASVIRVLTSSNACEDADFAIKGRTHAPAAGFANIDNGVTIDVTGMSSVKTNEDHSVASVGAGASWLDAYAYLDPLGKSVAGGRNGAVGVGGLTLGGGISYFSPRVGFTCDTVVNFEVILATGELVNANASHHADLFRALKGGTNNFGLVTRFDLATVDISKILGGSLANDISHRGAVFKAFADIASAKNYDVRASIVTGLLYNSTSKGWAVSSTPVYTLPELRPKIYEPLFAIPNISDKLEITHLHVLANETATPPLNWQFWTGTYSVSANLLDRMFDAINTTLYTFNPPEGIVWDIAFEPLPTVFTAPGAGKNSLGTSPDDGNQMIMLLSALWPDSGSNAKVHAKAAEVVESVNKVAREMGMLREFVYTNYADWSQRPLESNGGENVRFLRETARKYDPDGVFQRKMPGGFKLER